ncbi:MAG: hypothetical protein ACREU7_02130 [Burkholderiales bacterium]
MCGLLTLMIQVRGVTAAASSSGYVTIAPLQTDWTARPSVRLLQRWTIESPAASGN